VIHGGGIPQKNHALNQVYADVMGIPVMVPERSITSLGSALFAFMAAGTFKSLEEAQDALCPGYRVVEPRAESKAAYNELYPIYRDLYFAMGNPKSEPLAVGGVLPRLREIAAKVHRPSA
jgi:L-ribulokinase